MKPDHNNGVVIMDEYATKRKTFDRQWSDLKESPREIGPLTNVMDLTDNQRPVILDEGDIQGTGLMLDPSHVASGILPQRWAKFMDVADLGSFIQESELEDKVDEILGGCFSIPKVETNIKHILGHIVKMAAVE
jgi:hypothetical protein